MGDLLAEPFVKDYLTNTLPSLLGHGQVRIHVSPPHFSPTHFDWQADAVELSWDLFEIVKELGRGASGTAELVRRKCDGALMVIKCIPVSGWAVKCVTDICLMRTGKYSGG